MTIESGKYYAIAVGSDESYEVDMSIGEGEYPLRSVRSSSNQPEQLNEVDAAKKAVKDGIEEVKKGGLKAAFGLAKKFITEMNMDEREKLARKNQAAYKDPMDPVNAFALDDASEVRYESVRALDNKDNDLEYFQFRTQSSYGVLQRMEDGLLREVSFSFPSYEYAEKHNPLEIVQGPSNENWRREDDRLHKMRVHYLSKDKDRAVAASAENSVEQVRQEWFDIDFNSSRDQEKIRFSEPRFNLNCKNGEVTLYGIAAWFLPRYTKAGRQVQYNWDALRVRIMQGDQLIKRFVCWSAEKGHEVIRSQRTNMLLSDGGYIGALEPGQYQLQVSIYDDEVFCYPFEVIKTTSEDKQNAFGHYFNIRTPKDEYAAVEMNTESWDLDIYYPAVRLLDKCGSLEKFDLTVRALKDCKVWQGYEWNEYEKGGMTYDQVVRDKPAWADQRLKLSIPCGDHPTYGERKQAAKGEFTIEIDVNGEVVDWINLNITDSGQPEIQMVGIDQPLADIDFPEEHGGYLLAIK